MKNSTLALLGIIIILGGSALNFSLLAYTKTTDFWAGAAFILMPIFVGGCMLMIAAISPNDDKEKEWLK